MKLDAAIDVRKKHALPAAGAPAKGQFQCTRCGYGVTVFRELPRCPMCAGQEWRESPWTPFTHAQAVI